VGSAHQRPVNNLVLAFVSIALFLAISAALYFTNSHWPTQPPPASGSVATDQPHLAEESPSQLDWEQAASEIQALSAAADSLEQRAGQLWDEQPVGTPAKPQTETMP
jgi:hypothetical protein